MIIYEENHKNNNYTSDGHQKKTMTETQKQKVNLDMKEVPSHFFNENFRLDKSFFQINENQTAMRLNEKLSHYLEIVEASLVKNISENFDFFTNAFTNFDEMKEDLSQIS